MYVYQVGCNMEGWGVCEGGCGVCEGGCEGVFTSIPGELRARGDDECLKQQ